MLETIKNAVTGIMDFLRAVVDFVIKLVQDTIELLKLLADVPEQVESFTSLLPSFLIAFVGVVVGVAILFKILGRE